MPKLIDRKNWYSVRLLLFAFLGTLALLVPALIPAQSVSSAPQLPENRFGTYEGIVFAENNRLSLQPDAAAPPTGNSPYQRYGFYTSPVQMLDAPSSRVELRYDAAAPAGSAALLDVRASADGQHWTAWETGVSSGDAVDFTTTARMVQYRARLFGGESSTPTLGAISVAGVPGYSASNSPAAAPNYETVAPTFRIRGTRQGMIGGRTANGHIITPRDHFVSLPSWRSLASRGGYEYQVRITYNGRSATAPVWDVGPWNTRDDYWSPDRELYKDLPQGWPQDHAAYYEGHNGGYAQYGYVRFPTAIDVGDGIWWDVLGIRGDQAEVEVTFLWMGKDPLAGDPPSLDPNASEYMVNELGPAFHQYEASWKRSQVGCGEDEHAFLARSTTNPEQVENEAFWQPNLPVSRMYDVYVHVPVCPSSLPRTTTARYLVQHRDRAEEFVINQNTQTGWVLLGRFPFEAGDEGFVYLTNLAGDADHAVWFDNVKWVPVREE
jgi:hypothetical protein